MDREQIVKTLSSLRTELEAHYDVTEISLFGSFVRGEQRETSDIDILVKFGSRATFFDLVRLGLFLEDTLHRPVDVIPMDSLRAEFRDDVLHNRVLI
jgi:uncharacterized protein